MRGWICDVDEVMKFFHQVEIYDDKDSREETKSFEFPLPLFTKKR